MKFLIGIPLVLLAVAAIIALVAFHYVYRIWRMMRRTMRGDYTDEEVERLSRKYQRQKPGFQFDKDYFKSSTSEADNSSEWKADRQWRTTQTNAGVTIIDDRDPGTATRKIFTDDEGEYVEYTEV